MSDREERHRKIREFIRRLVGRDFESSEPLISSQILESIAAVQMVVFVERTFAVSVEDDELKLENFDTVAAIIALVDRKVCRHT